MKSNLLVIGLAFALVSSTAGATPNTRQCSNFDGSWTWESRLLIGGAMPPPGSLERRAQLKQSGTVVGTMEQRVGQGETWTGTYQYQVQSSTTLSDRWMNPGCMELETLDVIDISSIPTDGSKPIVETVRTICKEERCFYP